MRGDVEAALQTARDMGLICQYFSPKQTCALTCPGNVFLHSDMFTCVFSFSLNFRKIKHLFQVFLHTLYIDNAQWIMDECVSPDKTSKSSDSTWGDQLFTNSNAASISRHVVIFLLLLEIKCVCIVRHLENASTRKRAMLTDDTLEVGSRLKEKLYFKRQTHDFYSSVGSTA